MPKPTISDLRKAIRVLHPLDIDETGIKSELLNSIDILLALAEYVLDNGYPLTEEEIIEKLHQAHQDYEILCGEWKESNPKPMSMDKYIAQALVKAQKEGDKISPGLQKGGSNC